MQNRKNTKKMKFLKMIRYPYKNGIILPFKIYNKVYIKIKTTDLKLGSRLVFGNSKEKAVISVNPINLFFGYNTNVSFGKSVSLGPGTNIIIKITLTHFPKSRDRLRQP